MRNITVLYDNYIHDEKLQDAWGFSCLITGFDKTILFDTGGKADVLEANFNKLGIAGGSVDCVVISHMHWDHINGLEWLVGENDHLEIYLPASATDEFIAQLKGKTAGVDRLTEPKIICPGVYTTGTFDHEIPEQSLCLQTPKGPVVITGCSHPGIERILRSVKNDSDTDIELVIGGFHLKSYESDQIEQVIAEIQQIGVNRIAPTHCTGNEAIEAFRNSWKDNYIEIGVGKTVNLQ